MGRPTRTVLLPRAYRTRAAAALDHFLEDFYNSFQQRYGIQLYRYYRAIDERAARHRPMPSSSPSPQDPPF